MNTKIAILLSTFQSEKYLNCLLDSILEQTIKDWQLFIRDDGSKDGTKDIINKYVAQHNQITLLHDNILHRGPKESFFWLLDNTNAEYYMFCDHDDIWLPLKIESAFLKMRELESISRKNTPILVHSDLIVVDSSLNVISRSFWGISHMEKFISQPEYLPFFNFVTGCTMLINRSAKDVSIKLSQFALMHDSWIALNVFKNNGIIYGLSEAQILYRQHGNNALGAKKYNISFLNIISKIWEIINFNIKWFRMQKKVTNKNIFVYLIYKLLIFFKRLY
jgi:glycosyltransferase involved in cell wall biosynthesis